MHPQTSLQLLGMHAQISLTYNKPDKHAITYIIVNFESKGVHMKKKSSFFYIYAMYDPLVTIMTRKHRRGIGNRKCIGTW